jgi:valyl-tRNA synthetase
VIRTVNEGFGKYDMDDAARSLYEFLWSEFADWYVELAKPRLRNDAERPAVQGVLLNVLETSMRLLHPIMPFITEEIWQALPHKGESIMTAPFPEADESLINDEAEAGMAMVMESIRLIRNLRAEVGVTPGKQVGIILVSESPETRDLFAANGAGIRFVARTGEFSVAAEAPIGEKGQYVAGHGAGFDVYMPTAGLIDIDKEIEKITNELASIEKELARVTGKLSNEKFMSKAPAEIVEKERRIESELSEKKAKLEERKASLRG